MPFCFVLFLPVWADYLVLLPELSVAEEQGADLLRRSCLVAANLPIVSLQSDLAAPNFPFLHMMLLITEAILRLLVQVLLCDSVS